MVLTLTRLGVACSRYRREAGMLMGDQWVATGRRVAEISAIERGKIQVPPGYIEEFTAWLQLDGSAISELRVRQVAQERSQTAPTLPLQPPTEPILRLSEAAIRTKVGSSRKKFKLGFPVTNASLIWACEHGTLEVIEGYELHIEPDEELQSVGPGGEVQSIEAYVATQPVRMVVSEETYLQAFKGFGRARFSIAHELGHLEMHLPWLIVPGAIAERSTFSLSHKSRLETQANIYAAELLMPDSVARTARDPEALSALCGVSRSAAANRMQHLGVWPKPNPVVVEGFRQLLAQLKGEGGHASRSSSNIAVRQEAWGKLLYDADKDEFSAEVLPGHQAIPKAPIGIGWVIVGGCNAKCGICYGNDEELPRGHLALRDAFKLVNALKEAEIMRVVISGGEPLMYPRIFDVIDALVESKISVVLGTNGTFLSNLNAHRLAKCTRVEISLDAADRALNNQLRPSRLDGDSWQESITAIKSCLSLNIRVRVLTTVTRLNQNQLMRMADLMYEIGVTDWAISWVVPAGRAKHQYEKLRPDEAVIQNELAQIRRYCPGINVRYSSRAPDRYDRFYFLLLPNGQIATEDMARGKKASYGSALEVPILSTWTAQNFDIEAHFDKWVAGRVHPSA